MGERTSVVDMIEQLLRSLIKCIHKERDSSFSLSFIIFIVLLWCRSRKYMDDHKETLQIKWSMTLISALMHKYFVRECNDCKVETWDIVYHYGLLMCIIDNRQRKTFEYILNFEKLVGPIDWTCRTVNRLWTLSLDHDHLLQLKKKTL